LGIIRLVRIFQIQVDLERRSNVAKINSFSFGSIVIDGKKYGHDIRLFPDGSVSERKSGFWKFGSHNIRKEEIEDLVKTNPEEIIVGLGASSRAKLAPDVEPYLNEAGIKIASLPSAEAVEKLNQLIEEGKRTAGLIHITC
jgi:hypothetical protein